MAPPKSAGGGPPSFRTAAAAAGIKLRQQRQQAQLQQQQLFSMPMQQQMLQAPPGYALVPIPPAPPIVANAAATRPSSARPSFQCKWAGCRAAESARPTFGTQHYCYNCCRPKSQAMSPPSDEMAERYKNSQLTQQQQQPQQQQQQQQQQQRQPSGPAGSFPNGTVGQPAATPLTPAQKRAAKRARQRQAKSTPQSQASETTAPNASPAAKAAAAVKDLLEQPPPAASKSISEEVFPAKAPTGKKVELTALTKERALKLAELAQLVINSIQAEYSPAPPAPTPPTSTPTEQEEKLGEEADQLLNEILAKGGSASLENTRSLQQAEAALSTTTKTLLTFRSEGADENDPILKQLTERQRQQKESVERMKRGAPSLAAQKEALLVGKQKLLERQTLTNDRVALGKQAAKERASIRDDLLVQMTGIITELEQECDDAVASLETAHDLRNSTRKEVLLRALERCDEKTSQLEDVEFHDADEEALEAEKERDAANDAAREQQLINNRLQEQLQKLQAATQQADTQPVSGTDAPEQQQQPDPSTKKTLELLAASEKLLEESGLGVKDLPEAPDEPPSAEMLRELHQAWCMLEAVSLQPNAVITFNQLGLSPASLEAVFGPAWDRVRATLYSCQEVPPDQTFVPRKLAALVRIQLVRMAAKHRQVHSQDSEAMDEAYETVKQATTTRPSPYA